MHPEILEGWNPNQRQKENSQKEESTWTSVGGGAEMLGRQEGATACQLLFLPLGLRGCVCVCVGGGTLTPPDTSLRVRSLESQALHSQGMGGARVAWSPALQAVSSLHNSYHGSRSL